MGTGKAVDFSNGNDRFNMFLDSDGHLNFLANDVGGKGDRKMVVLDDLNEVHFDGNVTVEDTVTIGGSGQDGGLQLRASDGDNTLFLGSSGTETNLVMGGNHRDGHVQIKNDQGEVTVEMLASAGSLTLGASGQDGDITLVDQAGVRSIAMSGQPGTLDLWFGTQKAVALDASTASVTVGTEGASGKAGTIDVCNATGEVTIKLSGDQGLVEYAILQEDTTPDGGPTAVRDALARVLALQAVSYRCTGADGQEVARIGLLGHDVARVCPELTATVVDGRTGVNYSHLTAVLVEAVKDQQLLIDQQSTQLTDLWERLDRLEATTAGRHPERHLA